jgi:hypothetical protein
MRIGILYRKQVQKEDLFFKYFVHGSLDVGRTKYRNFQSNACATLYDVLLTSWCVGVWRHIRVFCSICVGHMKISGYLIKSPR